MFNVQIKNQLEVSLVYYTNQTKRLMEKLKKKAIEQSSVRKGSPMKGVGSMAERICTAGEFARCDERVEE